MRAALRVGLASLLGALYVSLFWLRPPSSWPAWLGWSRRHLIDLTAHLLHVPSNWAWAINGLVLGGVLPALLLLALRRRLGFTLLGPGNRAGWRLAAISYLGALIPLLALAARPDFRHYYQSLLGRDLGGNAARYLIVVCAEHVCIQAAILRLALGAPDRLPALPAVAAGAGPGQRVRRWLGLGAGGWRTALGVDGVVLAALLGQALIFGWVHLSKDVGELISSFPGGLAIGYLAWRSRSIWPCAVLHIASGVTLIALAVLFGMKIG
ncbi:MAG: CPBP family intramembrane metalloprotease [Deltaproteobacteria bacterium]|nr:CPBP family intramembrane metalloprotease [Deltaproteobacteria bacterium]